MEQAFQQVAKMALKNEEDTDKMCDASSPRTHSPPAPAAPSRAHLRPRDIPAVIDLNENKQSSASGGCC